MENLIYPDGLVIAHNGPMVSIASGNFPPVGSSWVNYDPDDHHVKIHLDFYSDDSETNGTWDHFVVFMGPPIESVSMRWDGQATEYYSANANIILKGGPGITTEVSYDDVVNMFNGNEECLEVRFDAMKPKPGGVNASGVLNLDCKMPDWVIPH